jgi:hypothetical protein
MMSQNSEILCHATVYYVFEFGVLFEIWLLGTARASLAIIIVVVVVVVVSAIIATQRGRGGASRMPH